MSASSRLSPRYSLRSDDVQVGTAQCALLASRISAAVCDDQGGEMKSVLGYSFQLDMTNSRIEPSNGYNFILNQDFAGIGGSTKFHKTELEMNIYKSFFRNDIVGSFKWETGFVFPWGGDKVRLSDRFRKGGSSFRGFEPLGIGPRDLATDDSIGGQAYGIGTFELSFPTGLPEEYGILAAVFFQFGTLGHIDDASKESFLETSKQITAENLQFNINKRDPN